MDRTTTPPRFFAGCPIALKLPAGAAIAHSRAAADTGGRTRASSSDPAGTRNEHIATLRASEEPIFSTVRAALAPCLPAAAH